MQRAIGGTEFARRTDAEAHCLAAALIAWRCSVAESQLASLGKELADVFGPGDASTEDMRSNRRGVQCARAARDSDDLGLCCRAPDAQ